MSALAALLSTLLLSPTATRAAPEPLRLAVSRGPVSLPVYVAEARGYFKAEGLDLQLQDCNSGRACFALVRDGQAELTTTAELQVAIGSLVSADVAILATLSTSSQQIRLVARRSAGIDSAERLAGKRIGTTAGTSAQYFLDTWLLFHDVDPERVRLVPMAPEHLPGALERREVDAVAIWEPHASAASASLGSDEASLPRPRVYTQHFNLVAHRRAIAGHEPELRKLLRALHRAQRLIAERPAEARRDLQARLQLDAAFAERALDGHDFRLSLDEPLLRTMDNQVRWALREGLVDGGRPSGNMLHYVEPAPLRSLLPAAVGLVQ